MAAWVWNIDAEFCIRVLITVFVKGPELSVGLRDKANKAPIFNVQILTLKSLSITKTASTSWLNGMIHISDLLDERQIGRGVY